MKKLLLLLLAIPVLAFSNDKKIPTKIKEVTVYLSGAQITRTALCTLKPGSTEYTFTGLSPKVDESSIQISGLKSVSVLSMAYNIDFLSVKESDPEIKSLESEIIGVNRKISLLQNHIIGLEEELKVIRANKLISGETQELNLVRLKEISTYYRERTTAIKNEIFKTNLDINEFQLSVNALQNQLSQVNNAPIKEQGELRIKFDAPVTTDLQLLISYTVQDAGWIPNYDIKSVKMNAPLKMTYKAHVYQKTGVDWNNAKINLSSGSPSLNVSKPNLSSKYLDFVSRYSKRYNSATKKKKYFHNPTVKKVVGQVTDESGLPLPGVNIVVKGTTNGTTTDFDGYYTMNIESGKELVFSYIGSKTIEVPIYSSIINTNLEADAQQLDEVVVTAMGTSKKSYTTGSVSSVKMEDALQGRTAGVTIRGYASTGNNTRYIKTPEPQLPLYIIDGVPVDDFAEGDLDENEIQSIESLKGESATALYGSRGNNGVVVITTKKSKLQEGVNSKFIIKKPYTVISNGDITAIELNAFELDANYEHFAAPMLNENVFMTATFKDWEKHNLLPGEANIYFEGTFAGKTTIDPYTTKKEMTLSLGIDPSITVTRKQNKNFKSKSFTGSNRILDRTYELVVKNSKSVPVQIKLMDRVPLSQNKEIKIDDIETYSASYDKKKGLLTWNLEIKSKETKTELFSFQVKYPKFKTISL
ncbi:DUF4139 domain-containing protein [Maribacter sp. HTCC2170]|uniref:DUF4139 domain-containing protein n=1 Tax=Maribacter sp. (strain HTCC2170 / KCCM 42371) TaxID=313603 RepID=UPI00006AFD8B|nr:DUF4139 domain-containing protein [Maribacter sp. HTCC2170]EAR01437.1 putative TonB-linked outer membrane protein [Maribacter sp. HTCC2170]